MKKLTKKERTKKEKFRKDLALEAYRLFAEHAATPADEYQLKEFWAAWNGTPSDLLKYLISFHHDDKPFSADPVKRAAFLEFEQSMMVLYLEERGLEDGTGGEVLAFLQDAERELAALKEQVQ
jgi:hypothetical protein